MHTALIALLLAASQPTPLKIAVLDLDAADESAAPLARSASLLIPTEVRKLRPDARVISSADIQAMLGYDRQRSMLGCTDDSCIAEIGGAIGANELVAGKLGKLGGTFILELRRLDARKVRTLSSAARTVDSAEGLVTAVRSAVGELMGVPQAALSVEPAGKGLDVAGLALTVGGAAALVAGGFGVYTGLSNAAAYNDQQAPGVAATLTRADAERDRIVYPISWAAAGLGAAALGWGIVRLASGDSEAPQVAVAPVAGGAMLAFGGSL